MAYFLNLFSPETWRAFRDTGASMTGFRLRHLGFAEQNVQIGDIFVCYLTRVSRWCGILEVETTATEDDSYWHEDLDIFPVRFRVKPLVVLDPEKAIPVYDDSVWERLSFTRNYQRGTKTWTGFFRTSLNEINEQDGGFLADLLRQQQEEAMAYPLSLKESRQLTAKNRVRTPDRVVEVEVPDDDDEDLLGERPAPASIQDHRTSIKYQAKVAEIGAKMGFRIWVPRHDKARVLEHVSESFHSEFLDILPLNYDDTTLRTIEQIDVLWLKGRSMARAFEIEHTTAIYSGLLRMADLLALQPNMDIRLHIVAPLERRDRVISELRRPVFSLLERGPLYEQCSYLSYDSIDDVGGAEHLSHMSQTILDEYAETTEV